MDSFVVVVPDAEVDVAVDVLWRLGVRAIEERTIAGGRVELWTAVGDDATALGRAVDALDGRWSHRREPAAATADTWRDFAVPMRIADRFVIVPAWQDPPDDVEEGCAVISIEPGAAFGLGDHPTTALTLRALCGVLDDVSSVSSVLDVGCGTGVLSIAAAVRGVERVRAIDVSSAAVEATTDNARRNGVDDRIEVDAAPLSSVAGTHDVVVANILAPTLIDLAPDLVRSTGRTLVISGILADRHDHVLASLRPLEPVETIELDGWAAVTLRRSVGGELSDRVEAGE